jgi:hypothetical protein
VKYLNKTLYESQRGIQRGFGPQRAQSLISPYQTTGDGPIDIYKHKLRQTNSCLKCFSTKWKIPEGRDDAAMNLLFTQYPPLLISLIRRDAKQVASETGRVLENKLATSSDESTMKTHLFKLANLQHFDTTCIQ